MQNWLKLGDYNCICDSCGRKFKASTMRKRWDGLFVCKEDFEPKHPQLSLKVHGDKQTVPIPRPDAIVDTFLPYCDLWTSSPIADFATADCAFVGGNTSIPILIDVFNPVAVAGYAIAGRSISRSFTCLVLILFSFKHLLMPTGLMMLIVKPILKM